MISQVSYQNTLPVDLITDGFWNSSQSKKKCKCGGRCKSENNGLGLAPQQINTIASTGAGVAVTTLVGLSVIGGPVGAAIGGLIAVGSLVANMFHGCGNTCIVASQDANKIESYLQQNLSAYFSSPTRYISMQTQALQTADTLLNGLMTACSDPSLGDAGKRCISERLVKGGTAPWCPTKTGCDWITLYRDPITNDSGVVSDPSLISTAGDSINNTISNVLASVGTNGTGFLPFALIGLGLVIAFSGD